MGASQRDRQVRLQRRAGAIEVVVHIPAEMFANSLKTLRFAVLSVWLASCGAVATGGDEPLAEPAVDCPATHTLNAQSCSASLPVGYGSLRSKPLEWGATRAGALYFGRLVCPNGGLAMTERTDAPVDTAGDAVETWEVHCPGDPTPRIWYATPRRCGNPCPPDGLRVIPQPALQRYLASVAAFEAGDAVLALQRIDEAVALAPPNELMTLWKGTMLEQTGRALEAVPFYEAAVRMNPDEPAHKLFLARAQRAAGHEAPYRSAIEDLLGKLPSGHPLVPELQCLKAELLRHDGKLAEAHALADTACKGGQADCCPGK